MFVCLCVCVCVKCYVVMAMCEDEQVTCDDVMWSVGVVCEDVPVMRRCERDGEDEGACDVMMYM